MRSLSLLLVTAFLAQTLSVGCSDDALGDAIATDAGPLDAATAADSASPPADAAADAASAVVDAAVDAAPDGSVAPPVPTLGNCTFNVDGQSYQSAVGDIFTTAALADGSLTVQCVAIAGAKRLTVNLAVNGVTAPGSYPNTLAQISEQPAEGGSADQYRSFTASLLVQSLDATTVAGSSSFAAAGSGPTKNVSVAFNLVHR